MIKRKCLLLLISTFYLFSTISTIVFAMEIMQTPPMPARIGGIVAVDGTLITQSNDTGYTFTVTRQDGTSYDPVSEDTDGLNEYDFYIIDIPIFDADTQPGGANPGDDSLLHVFFNGTELQITSPDDGQITVGESGSLTQIDIEAMTSECTDDADCDDGLFCNGAETCLGGGCEAGTYPCKEGEECDEVNDKCLPPPIPCDVSIEPTYAEVSSKQSLTFTINPTGDCTDPNYKWSVESTIDSEVDQNGNYVAGINNNLFNKVTDVVKIVEHTSGSSAEATVTVSWGCLLLTIYDEVSEEIEVLRNFRDNVLSQTPEGRELIKLYYEWSPAIVRAMEEDEEFKEEVKEMIDEVLELITKEVK